MGWRAVLAGVLVVQAGTAQAVVDPCYADAVIARAAAVIQITGFRVEGPGADDRCTITGTVAKVFRGRQFDVGDVVATSVACAGDPEVMCGSGWYDPESIRAAGAIEVHVEREGDGDTGAEGVLLLEGVTERMEWSSACGN
jgi:hypothetical protein